MLFSPCIYVSPPCLGFLTNAFNKEVLDEDLLLLLFVMRIFKGILKKNGRTRQQEPPE